MARTGPGDNSPTPLIILTGFLGAGKTTALNRVLEAQHHRRVAVLVNELGRIDVDAALIRGRAGDVLELAGGCVCHQIGVQRELWSALADVIERSRPDVVVLETTGIAEPDAIVRGLEALARSRPGETSANPGSDEDGAETADDGGPPPGTWSPSAADEARRRALAGLVSARNVAVVTVVDGESGDRHLARHPEARAQVVAADRILLSKLDLATGPTLAAVHAALNELNPAAERAGFPAGGAGAAAMVPWLLEARPRADWRSATGHDGGAATHHHAHQLTAATFVDDAPLVGPALALALESFGDALVRAKGFVALAGEPRRGILQRAGARTVLELGDAWGDEPRVTRLVLIGEDLDEAVVQRRLWACRALAAAT